MPSQHIRKRHSVSLLMYHLVAVIKYRRGILTPEVEATLKQVCLDISDRYEVGFLEIGCDLNHIHFLIQLTPKMAPSSAVQIIKSILARKIFGLHPEVKKKLWGGKLWSDSYYINTVSKYGGEETIQRYIQNQGRDYKKEYKQIYKNNSLDLFEEEGLV